MEFTALLVSVLVVVMALKCQSLLILVNDKNGTDTPDCLAGGPSCQSLDYVSYGIYTRVTSNNNLTVKITNQDVVIRDTVSLSKLNYFTLQGTATVITCVNSTTNGSNGTGLQFSNSMNLRLVNFTLVNCSLKHSNAAYYSVLIKNCTNVSVTNVSIASSSGLSIVNSSGDIVIESCIFGPNHIGISNPSNGLLIKTGNTGGTKYRILKTIFIQNDQVQGNVSCTRSTTLGCIMGGGAMVIISSNSRRNEIEINGSWFIGNSATFGGGLAIKCEFCENNDITILNTLLEANYASIGGGAVYITMSGEGSNSVTFNNCTMYNNGADLGGGVAISTTSLSNHIRISYQTCNFSYNYGFSGAAIDASPLRNVKKNNHDAFDIQIRNCSFSNNRACESTGSLTSRSRTGIFFTFKLRLHFVGFVSFEDNEGTALYASNTNIVTEDALLVFSNNTGEFGGGLLLLGEAFITSHGNNHFIFKQNKAFVGGGICSMVIGSNGYFQYSEICFIQKNPTYYHLLDEYEFENNSAVTDIAGDIFVSNLRTCTYKYNCRCHSNYPDYFNNTSSSCSGNVTFKSSSASSQLSYATSTEHIKILPAKIEAFPGIVKQFLFQQVDQLNQNVDALFPISISLKGNSLISIDESKNILKGIEVRFKGHPGDSATLILQSNTLAVLKTSVTIHLIDCPPGLYFNPQNRACECIADQLYHSGIDCKGMSTAKLKASNWAGYLSSTKTSESFATAACLHNFCNIKATPMYQYYILEANKSTLEQFVCGDYRRGVLCSLCKDGYTTYFNSPSFICGKETLCSLGVPFFILTEIVPVTVFFFSVILFNIPLTSGSLYSFVFYAQTLDFFYIDVSNSVKFHGSTTQHLVELYRIIYGFFNLRFFYTDTWSFCFFEKMNTMDLFVLQYATMAYVFVLIFVTVSVMKINHFHSCIKLCHKLGKRNVRSSIVNALTAVFVFYYYKSIELTYSTLQPDTVFVRGQKNRTVALFNGELKYLEGDHLKYAIPAFICLIVIIFPPPIVLLIESTASNIIWCFNDNQNCFVISLMQLKAKLKPYVKSLQGCFSENYQCFAGLFFVYRLLLHLPKLVLASISVLYVSSELIVFAILVIHYTFQPFRKPWHNKLDVLLLTNFLLVNMITIHNYYTRNVSTPDHYIRAILDIIQIAMMSIPLLYMLFLGIHHLGVKFKAKQYFKTLKRFSYQKLPSLKHSEIHLSDSFPARLLTENTADQKWMYSTFENDN